MYTTYSLPTCLNALTQGEKKKKKTANILRSVPCIARKHQGISFIIKTRHTSQSVEIGGRNRKEKRV